MLLNSLTFLGFFAAAVVAYYLVPRRFRWILLLVASYYFYSTYDPRYLILLAAMTLVAYVGALLVARIDAPTPRRWMLGTAVVLELAALVAFKYFDFLMGSLEPALATLGVVHEAAALPRLEFLLPVGLSFYSFSCVSYLVDVHRGVLSAQRHLGLLATYLAFFPKLIAGPIERAEPFLRQLAAGRDFRASNVTAGAQIMLWGLFKKVVIADRLAAVVDPAFSAPAFQSPAALVVAIYFYAFQIYCDFSGYSDMAIGAARIMGFRLGDNFLRPYLSQNPAEFWSARWHISLASWFKDYMYIPLGGNRGSKARTYANQMAVFVVSGLWHGAAWTFVVWGALNGLYQVIFLLLKPVRKWLRAPLSGVRPLVAVGNVLITFHLVSIAWVFFRADSIQQGWTVLRRVGTSLVDLPGALSRYAWTGEVLLSLGLIALLMVLEGLDERHPLRRRLARQPTVVRWGAYYALVFSLIALGVWNMNEFVYMQF